MKNKIITLIAILSLFFLTSCGQATGGAESSLSGEGQIKVIKITANQADVKNGCSASSPVIQTQNKGTKLDVINKVANWYAVKLPNNQVGFVPEDQATPVVPDNQAPEITPGDTGAPTNTPGQQTSDNNNNTNNNTYSLTGEEQQMLKLVNDARSQNGVSALQIDTELANVARIKSQDMIDNNYFSHNSPKYGSPFDMMKKFGIEYVKAGENIAGNRSVQAAHDALMNSPGHRKNILSPDYTHIGIGIKNGGQYGKMFTQMFVSKPK